MNNKKTNHLVLILTIIITILSFILHNSKYGLLETSMIYSIGSSAISIYGSSIAEFVFQYSRPFIISILVFVGILNIICALQNKKNKKLSFWFLAFGITTIFLIIDSGKSDMMDIIRYIKKFVFIIIPLVFAIKNIILEHKNNPKPIQIISYIAIILISLLFIFNILPFYLDVFWWIIIAIMLFIYIHLQGKNIVESKSRKITNILLYYFLQLVICISILIIILLAFLPTFFNNEAYAAQLLELYDTIKNSSNFSNNESLILVKNNNKYGYINSNGQEVIPCEYDNISKFYMTYSNHYISLGKKNNEYYILSRDNQTIHIKDKKYIQTIDNIITSFLKESTYLSYNDVEAFSNVLYCYMSQAKFSLDFELQYDDENPHIDLSKNETGKYFINNNFSIYLETFALNYDEYNVTNSEIEKLFNVSVTQFKNNITYTNSKEYLPGYFGSSIDTFSDGSIEFESIDKKTHGWYASTGQKYSIPIEYDILDVQGNMVFLKKGDIYCILNLKNNSIMNVQNLIVINGKYAYKNKNGKMVLHDKDLSAISNEYDERMPSFGVPTYFINYRDK